MPKRGENIYKRKDGRYEGRYIKGRREDGKPRFGYIYAYTYSEVKAALTIAKAEWRTSAKRPVIGRGTLTEFLQYWLENTIRGRVKPSTYARYYERVYNHIIPGLGHFKLQKITPEQARLFADGLEKKGLAPSTVTGIMGVLRSVLKKAIEFGAIISDPCERIKLSGNTLKKARALDRQQQLMLEELAKQAGQGTGIAVFLSLYTGIRIGEICALRWRDIDFSSGTLTVCSTVQRIRNFDGGEVKTMLVETAPKSKTSYRTIPLQSELSELLFRHSSGSPQDWYVLSDSEKMVDPRILRARFAALVRKADLNINFHVLRHPYVKHTLIKFTNYSQILFQHIIGQTLSRLPGSFIVSRSPRLSTKSQLCFRDRHISCR